MERGVGGNKGLSCALMVCSWAPIAVADGTIIAAELSKHKGALSVSAQLINVGRDAGRERERERVSESKSESESERVAVRVSERESNSESEIDRE